MGSKTSKSSQNELLKLNSSVPWTLLFKQDVNNTAEPYLKMKQQVYSKFKKFDFDEYRDSSDNLYFLMYWPGLQKMNPSKLFAEGMIWSQMSLPTATKVQGYKAIFVPYPGPGNKDFGGLERSSSSAPCAIDGNAGIWNWHYAVGTTKKWGQGIPGPIAHGKEYSVHCVELYILKYPDALKGYGECLYGMFGHLHSELDRNISIIVAEYCFDVQDIIKMSLSKIYAY